MNATVRICSLEINNIKNVRHGKIEMPNQLSGHVPGKGELAGIYGRNGSGKTAVVNALLLVKRHICGLPLEADTAPLITCGETEATISVLFSLEENGSARYAQYAVTLGQDADGARVRQEIFAINPKAPGAKFSTVARFHEPKLPASAEFAPYASFAKALSHSARQDIVINKVLAYQEHASFIFSRRMYLLLQKLETDKADALGAVRRFAKRNLFVILHSNSGLVNVNLQPIPFSHSQGNCEPSELGTCLINLNAPSSLPVAICREFSQSLMHMNQVMCKIIPGFGLKMRELGSELSAANEEMMRFELLAVRQGMEIPLKFESDGIKKIIAILLYWIIVSNTPAPALW